jgi:hypothetical protein
MIQFCTLYLLINTKQTIDPTKIPTWRRPDSDSASLGRWLPCSQRQYCIFHLLSVGVFPQVMSQKAHWQQDREFTLYQKVRFTTCFVSQKQSHTPVSLPLWRHTRKTPEARIIFLNIHYTPPSFIRVTSGWPAKYKCKYILRLKVIFTELQMSRPMQKGPLSVLTS